MIRTHSARKVQLVPLSRAGRSFLPPGTCAALLLLSARVALAQAERELEIELDAPSTCASGAQIYERVESLTGSLKGSRHLRAQVRFEVQPDVVQVRLKTEEEGQTFERELEASGCSDAVQTTALILALALRHELAASNVAAPDQVALAPATTVGAANTQKSDEAMKGGAAAAAPPTTQPNEPAQPREAGESTEPKKAADSDAKVAGTAAASRAAPKSWQGFAFIGVLGELGTLPTAGYGFSASGGVRLGGLSGELYGLFEPAVSVTVEGTESGGEFSLWTLGLRGCWMQTLARTAAGLPSFEAGLCVLGEGGQLAADGFGTATTHSVQTAWGAIGTGAGFSLGLGRAWLLRLDPALLVPLVRDAFQIEDGGQSVLVAEVGQITGRLELRLGLHF